jgi:hypothetical protein
MDRFAFLDTNTFLHYRSFDEWDWPTVLSTESVGLVLAPIVLRELDEKKYAASGKLRDRSKSVVQRLHRYLVKGNPVEIRPFVKLELLATEPTFDFSSHGLSKECQDDHLIASMISYRELHPGAEIFVVTGDIGLCVKAKANGITAVSPPDVNKLTEEQDPNEKTIQQLQRELLEYKRLFPVLTLAFRESGDRLVVSLKEPDALLREDLLRENKHIKLKHPKLGAEHQDQGTGRLPNWPPIKTALDELFQPTAQQVEAYNKQLEHYYEQYGDWLIRCREYAMIEALKVAIPLRIENSGTTPANGIDVQLDFPDGFLLLSAEQFPREPQEPVPPEKPTSSILPMRPSIPDLNIFSSLGGVRGFERSNVSLRNIRKSNSYEVNYTVEKLKHSQGEDLDPLAVVFQDRASAGSFNFGYRIYAENMPKVVERRLHVVVHLD